MVFLSYKFFKTPLDFFKFTIKIFNYSRKILSSVFLKLLTTVSNCICLKTKNIVLK